MLFKRVRRKFIALIGVLVALALLWPDSPVAATKNVIYQVHFSAVVEQKAQAYGLDPNLVAATIKVESNWNPFATSKAGAIGLMQVLPTTAQDLVSLGLVDGSRYDPQKLYDIETNIEFGCAYLSYLQGKLDDDQQVIAAYNAGLSTVRSWLAQGTSIPHEVPYAETAAYVKRVLAARTSYAEAYPQGLTNLIW